MKTPPKSMTVYQLTNAIAWFKSEIANLETEQNPVTKARLGRYRSALHVHEFQLQRQKDVFNQVSKKALAQVKKQMAANWAKTIELPFDPEQFASMVHQTKTFIQNYNQ